MPGTGAADLPLLGNMFRIRRFLQFFTRGRGGCGGGGGGRSRRCRRRSPILHARAELFHVFVLEGRAQRLEQ